MILKVLSIMMLACSFVNAQPVQADETRESVCSPSGGPATIKKAKGRGQIPEELFKQSYDGAECLRQAAAAKGAEWLETESLLLRSIEEADGGRWENALTLVQKAHFQAEQALSQAEHETEAWKRRVLK